MGKHSNIIFCDDKDMILDSIKHVSVQMSSVREVLPGRTYFIPDTMEKSDPLSVDVSSFMEILRLKPVPLGKAIYTSFTGISPVIAEDICFLAGLDSQLPASELDEDTFLHLFRQFSYYMDDIRSCHFHPCIYYDGTSPKDFGAVTLSHFSNYTKQEFTLSQRF